MSDFFYFRKEDRRVIVLLAIVAVFCVGVMLVVNAFHSKDKPTSPATSTEHLTSDTIYSQEGQSASEDTFSAETSERIAPFDPNTIDSATLVSYGVQAWKVKNFIHYRNAGKVFRSADDMLDTYGWTKDDLKTLRPYIRIGKAFQKKEHVTAPYEKEQRSNEETAKRDSLRSYMSNKFKEHTLVDINTADTTLLKRIPGIGSHFARSIVRYREKLGGYHQTEQLIEIHDFPTETLDWFTVSTPLLKKIDINKADFKQMASHPYIGYDNTKRIKNYQRLYGNIKSIDQLETLQFFSKDELQRLLPYLEGF